MRLIDVAHYLGVSKQRAHHIAATRGFPKPAKRLRTGRLWEPSAIESWAEREWWGKRPWRTPP